jgi:glycosyltransferase involved in cell wall biosynthesis
LKKIIIDAFHAGTGRGVGNYVDNILSELDKSYSGADNIIAVVRKGNVKTDKYLNIKLIIMPPIPFPIWENVLIPILCWIIRPKILHSPCNSGPLIPIFSNRLLTLHDVIFMHNRDKVEPSKNLYQRFGRLYLKLNIKLLSRWYKYIFTVSNFSRKEIVSLFPAVSNKVVRIYEGAGSNYGSKVTKKNMNKIVLHFGSDDPRKNTLRTIKAFTRSGLAEYGYTLVVIGSVNVSDLNIRDTDFIVFKGFLDSKELARLAKKSFCLLYCSLYEGFGMPIIEFQKIGIPVITSNTTSCVEICGQGGILVDPLNIENISTALTRLHSEKGLTDTLINNGFVNSSRYSWESCVLELSKFYDQ